MWTLVVLLTIFIAIDNTITNAYRVFNVDGVETILATENEKISIECKSGVPLAYCGFVHPNGKRYSFTGPDLKLGRCRILVNATNKEVGEWRCHIGEKLVGVETLKRIRVRLVKPLAAIRTNMTVTNGQKVTLLCITAKGLRPINYCRFEPPNGAPFSINADVNASSAILGKYFYPQNKSIDRGDCAVTIHKVKNTDVGLWTCSAGLDDGKEYTDTIEIAMEGLYNLSTASVTGITFGAVAIVAILIVLGVFAWKKRSFLGSPNQEPESIEVREVSAGQRSSPRSSPKKSRPKIPSIVVEPPPPPDSSPSM